MANWNNPTLADLYADFLTLLKDRDNDLATMFDSPGSNLPVGTIRYDSINKIFQRWSGAVWSTQAVSVGGGGTGATTAAGARTSLGLGAVALDNVVPVARGGTGGTDAATARGNLGLGSMAVQNSNNVSISGGTISALTSPLPVAAGGTGGNNAASARANLGLGSIATLNIITEGYIADGHVTVNKIANGHVTAAKLAGGAAVTNLGYWPAQAVKAVWGTEDYRAWDSLHFGGQQSGYYTDIPGRLGYTPPLPPEWGFQMVFTVSSSGTTLPAGGTWAWWYQCTTNSNFSGCGVSPGGTFLGLQGGGNCFMWRIH